MKQREWSSWGHCWKIQQIKSLQGLYCCSVQRVNHSLSLVCKVSYFFFCCCCGTLSLFFHHPWSFHIDLPLQITVHGIHNESRPMISSPTAKWAEYHNNEHSYSIKQTAIFLLQFFFFCIDISRLLLLENGLNFNLHREHTNVFKYHFMLRDVHI